MTSSGTLIPVNCFGFGGANVHVLTEIANHRKPSTVRVTEPMPRLIQLCGRTVDAVNFIANKLQAKQDEYMTNDFLSLVNDFATIKAKEGMGVRGYLIATDDASGSGYVFEKVAPMPIAARPLNLIYKGAADCKAHFEQLMEMPVFAATVHRANAVLKSKHELNLLNGVKETPCVVTVRSVALQMAMADTLNALNVG